MNYQNNSVQNISSYAQERQSSFSNVANVIQLGRASIGLLIPDEFLPHSSQSAFILFGLDDNSVVQIMSPELGSYKIILMEFHEKLGLRETTRQEYLTSENIMTIVDAISPRIVEISINTKLVDELDDSNQQQPAVIYRR